MMGRLKREATSTFSLGGWLPIVHRASPHGCRIALTLDDGPTPETTRRVLSLLESHGARATFFLCGKRAAAHPDLVAAIVEAGHGVYAHGYEHLRLDRMPENEALDELERTEEVLSMHRPTPSPYLVRLPYGSGHRSARIHRLLRRWRPGCQVVHWRYDFKDFRLAEGCADQQALNRNCKAAVQQAFADPRFPGSVVLMHENPFEAPGSLVPEIAVALLGEILDAARHHGIAVVAATGRDRQSLFARCVRTVPME